jgi:hypothetical protein
MPVPKQDEAVPPVHTMDLQAMTPFERAVIERLDRIIGQLHDIRRDAVVSTATESLR